MHFVVRYILNHDLGPQVKRTGWAFSCRTQVPGAVITALEMAAAAAGWMSTWLDDVPSGAAVPLSSYLSNNVDNDAEIRIYNKTGFEDGSPSGGPMVTQPFTHNVGSSALANEVCVKATLWATTRGQAAVEVGSTRPKARQTGGIYFGPLAASVTDQEDGATRVHQTFRDDLRQAIVDFNAGLKNLMPEPCELAVWSRADAVFRVAGDVVVDNALDTQRRRGEAPTRRESQTLL